MQVSTSLSAGQRWSFAALLAALSMIGPFSVDAYLPAFPAIGRDLGVAQLAVQQTLSIYLIAFAFMMLWHGAISDVFGRKPVIVAGLIVYTIATLGCAIAGNIETLWLFRALQGMSAGTGAVLGRAMIRDRFQGAEAQRLMSQVTLVFGVAPAVAPVIGGLLLNAFGWRSVFWFMFALSCALLVLCVGKLPETHLRSGRQRLAPRALWRNYAAILRRPEFLLLACIPALNFAAFFIYIASAPAFLIDLLGVSSSGFAWLFVPMIAGVMLGAVLSGRLAGELPPQRTVLVGYALLFLGCAINLLVSSLSRNGVALHVLPIMIFSAGSSLIMPSVTLLMLDLFPTMRGLLSSLQAFVQFGFAALVAGSLAPALSGSLMALALGMVTLALASFVLWRIYSMHVPTRTTEFSS